MSKIIKLKESDLKEIRKAYILAKALNVQYQFIRELVNPELKKSVNEAKAKNSYVIKIVNDYLENLSVEMKNNILGENAIKIYNL